jgi:hypothetical protein
MLLLLIACQALQNNGAEPQSPVAVEPLAPVVIEPVAIEPVAITPTPSDFRACDVDSDCVVVPTISGLTHAPTPDDSCQTLCTFAIASEYESGWLTTVSEHPQPVPCELEMEPCPPDDDWSAVCVDSRCSVRFAP